eukprot:1560175-Rhodomonas_salina.1
MQTNAASVDIQVAGVRAIWGLLWRDNAAWKDTQRVFASVAEQGRTRVGSFRRIPIAHVPNSMRISAI